MALRPASKIVNMVSGSVRFSVVDEGKPGKKPTVTEGAGSRLRRLLGR